MGAAENKKLMQDICAKVAEGDGSMFVEHLADEVTMKVTGKYSWSQTFRGKASVLRDLFGYLRSLTREPGRMTATRFIADGDHVAVEGFGAMVTKEGVPYENEYCLVYRLQAGKIVEIREYQDSALCERILGPYPARQQAAETRSGR